MLILAAGFGIFALSSFPPTQRFGVAVAGGTLAAAAIALFVLPWLATVRAHRADVGLVGLVGLVGPLANRPTNRAEAGCRFPRR